MLLGKQIALMLENRAQFLYNNRIKTHALDIYALNCNKELTETMARLMDFTTETPECCEIGDILQVEEHKLPTSYWYMLEHAYGASGNFKNRERLKTRSGKVVKKWNDDRFKYLTLEFDE